LLVHILTRLHIPAFCM